MSMVRWFIFFVLTIAVVGYFNSKRDYTDDSAVNTEKSSKLEKEEIFENIDREILSIGSFDADDFSGSTEQILIGALVFSVHAKLLDSAKKFELSEQEKRKLSKFHQLVVATQKRALPKLRDAFGPASRKKLWEHDISARTIGSGYRTIEFVGGIFSANRNIKKFQEELSESFLALRFKRSQYKWFKGASEFTYFDMKNPGDDALIVFHGKGRYETVDQVPE